MAGEPFQTRYWTKLAGINDSLADQYIQVDSEFSTATRNYMPDEQTSGVLIKREGLTITSSVVGSTITSIYEGRNGNYFTAGTGIYNFAGTSVGTRGFATTPTWTTMANYDILADGFAPLKTSNGTTWASISSCPDGAKYVAAVNNFLYASAGDGTLVWSDLGTIESFQAVNALVITANENNNITALKPWRNALFVGCQKSFHLITGYTTLEQAISFYSREEGCLSHQSVCVTPVGLIWWSNRGITVLGNEMALDFPMQRKLQGTFATLNRAYDSSVHAVHDPLRKRVQFYCWIGANRLRIDYHYFDDSFWIHDGIGTQMYASGTATLSGVTDVYVGAYDTTAALYKIDGTVGTDAGTTITSVMETAREAFGGPSILKMGRKASISTNLTTSAALTYGFYVDNATSLTKSYSITPATGGVETRIGINSAHYKIKHRISDTATTRTRIYGIAHDGYVVRSV